MSLRPSSSAALRLLALIGLAALTACTRPGPGEVTRADQPFDPYEAQNRQMHEVNLALDRAVLRPAGTVYATVVPQPVNQLVGNFSANLGTPSDVVNNLLQGRLKDAGINTVRFVMNSTIGVGGLIDAAGAFGIPARDTDFGETLAIWGVPEGAYQELPVLGPSTERATAGRIVDLFTNPLDPLMDRSERQLKYGSAAAHGVGQRGYNRETVDSVLYESADSYAQLRLIYLQSRRHALGAAQTDAYLDPYGDTGEEANDPYIDPYAE
ncbi:MlaA family lipoprotein [Oceanicola sp. S124]|uniref:MlaA family lipoprotein n=1 Tax=Oceanicola sp. S124 TaxID=1042378 RepID=UPI0002558155|nr:VacJ family lipoprotein [Oceanicola sp. S124]